MSRHLQIAWCSACKHLDVLVGTHRFGSTDNPSAQEHLMYSWCLLHARRAVEQQPGGVVL